MQVNACNTDRKSVTGVQTCESTGESAGKSGAQANACVLLKSTEVSCTQSSVDANCKTVSNEQSCNELQSCNINELSPDLKLSELKHMNVVIAGKTYSALIDGGAQMPLIKTSLVDNVSYIGTINIQEIVGNPVLAKLTVLDVAKSNVTSNECELQDVCDKGPLHLVFAVTDLGFWLLRMLYYQSLSLQNCNKLRQMH